MHSLIKPARCKRITVKSPFSELILLALTVTFGLHVIRVLVPGLTWILGDRFGLGAVELGVVALVLFMLAFLAGKLRSLFGNHWAVVISAGGLGLLRFTMQFSWGEPLINLVLAMFGTVFFVLFLPIYLDKMRSSGIYHTSIFALGLLIGVTLDTAIHGFFSTVDAIWNSDVLTLLLILALVLIQWLMLASTRTNTGRLENNSTDRSPKYKSLAWIAIGPFFFIELVVFQNIARLATLTNWPLPLAFGWMILTQLLSLLVVVWLIRKGLRTIWPPTLIFGLILLTISIFPYPQGAWLVAFRQLIGQVAISSLLVLIIISISNSVRGASHPNSVSANGLGMISFVVLLLGYYAVYQINLPYNNTILEFVAASIVVICALASSVRMRKGIQINAKLWLVPGFTTILMILPLIAMANWHDREVAHGNGFPVQVMTYNLHNGFNTDGYLNMEAIAQVIEDNNPDIAVLQEISRGWVINGSVDMLTWLSQRLNMPYISGPTADPLWGNAILSRYPIIDSKNYDLPKRDLFILRGFTATIFDIGNDIQLQVIATHFHHLDDGSYTRQMQSQEIIDFWSNNDLTIILGDFNAEPDAPEIEILRQAGLVDSLVEEPSSSTYTFHSANLHQRIDYIWLSPDLKAQGVYIPFSNVSDHLPVLATISN